MFKVTKYPEFTHDISALVPTDGGHDEQTFKARFRVLPGDEADEFDLNTTAGLRDFLTKVIVVFEDIENDAGEPAIFNDRLCEQMLGLPYVRIALLRTYMTAVTKERLKN